MRRTRAVSVVVSALMVGACGRAPSLEELTSSADALSVPANWEFVGEESAGPPCSNPVENCPAVERSYRVPENVDFGEVIVGLFNDAGLAVWDPPTSRCHQKPEQGCNAGAEKGDIAMQAIVIDVTTGSYTVFIRTGENVGP